jgi:dihydroorotate dehydrogenase (NAD+) catalytic subunit
MTQFEITKVGKQSLWINNPVMPAAGAFGFGDVYRDLVDVELLGALVTNPITWEAWSPATGTRIVPMDAGALVHTGLPNMGLNKTIQKYRETWAALPIPLIVHLVGTTAEHSARCAQRIEEEEAIRAIELGLSDDITPDDARKLVVAAVNKTEKPVMVRLPLQDALGIAQAVEDGGASTLVVAAPPRGTARDPHSGRLFSARIYGPIVKPLTLRMVGQLARRTKIPIIGSGGIHSAQDARDYMEAGARAVQVDSAVWVQPKLIEQIAKDFAGLVTTREAGALPDEWSGG